MISTGTIVGNRYRVTRTLGGGGMKQVYLAEDQRLASRSCALAEMIDSFISPSEQQTAIAAFEREADLLAGLSHDRIVRIYDKLSDGNRHFLVMEYVEGETLEQRLQVTRSKQLGEKFVVDTALQILDALEYLHGRTPPIIYRDLKPANVMITTGGRVKLIDFGIARLFSPKTKVTMVGTQGYAAPEQYKGEAEPRSDLFALGAMMFHLFTGWDPAMHPPFMFPPIQSLRADLSPALAALVGEALILDADRRIGNAGEFRRRLENLKTPSAGLNAGAFAPPPVIGPPISGPTVDSAPTVVSSPAQAETETGATPIPPPLQPTPGTCPGCHAQLPPNANFCPYCTRVIIGTDTGNEGDAGTLERSRRLVWIAGTTALIGGTIALLVILVANAYYANQRHRILEFRGRPLMLEIPVALSLSDPSGTGASGEVKSAFLDTEVAKWPALKWQATFKNQLAGVVDDQESLKVVLTNSKELAHRDLDEQVPASEAELSLSDVLPLPAHLSSGDYKLGIFNGDTEVASASFTISEDPAEAAQRKAQRQAQRAAQAQRESQQAIEESHRWAGKLKQCELAANCIPDDPALAPPGFWSDAPVDKFGIAAQRGDAEAEYVLGLILYGGVAGVPKDQAAAAEWYRKSAQQGYAPGEDRLSYVVPEWPEALRWRRKAADDGDPVAQVNLGFIYLVGKPVVQDYGEAAHWFGRAANQGQPLAEASLAELYEKGQGVTQDREMAIYWYRKAAARGFSNATIQLQRLGVSP